MPKKQTPYGVIDVNAQGVALDTPATRAALAAARAANPGDTFSSTPQMPLTADVVTAAQDAGNTSYNPGYTPDYTALIQGDPILRQQKFDLSAQDIQSAAERKAATDRALAQFGEVPDFGNSISGLGLDPNSPMFKMLFGDVDQNTQQTAQDMTSAGLSTTAQLGKTHQDALNNLMDQLAARGVVRSGATSSGVNSETGRYTGAQFSARQNLLDYLTGLQTAYTQSATGRQSALTQDLTDATTRQIAEHPAVAATGTAPTGNAGTNVPPPPPPVVSSGDPPPVTSSSLPPAVHYGGEQALRQDVATKPPSLSTNLLSRLNLPQ